MINDLDNLSLSEQENYTLFHRMLNAGTSQSNSLAAFIVFYRTFKTGEELAKVCMMELAWRRKLGEEFDFESYIETEAAKIPKVKPFDPKKLGGLLSAQALVKLIGGK